MFYVNGVIPGMKLNVAFRKHFQHFRTPASHAGQRTGTGLFGNVGGSRHVVLAFDSSKHMHKQRQPSGCFRVLALESAQVEDSAQDALTKSESRLGAAPQCDAQRGRVVGRTQQLDVTSVHRRQRTQPQPALASARRAQGQVSGERASE